MESISEDHAALLQDHDISDKESFDSEDTSFLDVANNSARRREWRTCLSSHYLLLAHLVIFLIYTATFVLSLSFLFKYRIRDGLSLPGRGLHPTAMKDAFRYNVRTVNYNFEDINPFKGHPVEEVDREWSNLLNGAHEVRLSPQQMQKSNVSSIQLADGSEDYIVQPIAYHMLHCLYTIYKYAHTDYYGEDPSGAEWMVTHTDHCVDNIRQFVQCHAGEGVSTFKWLPNRKIPWPVLNTDETCIDWNYYDDWVRQHSVDLDDIRSLKDGQLLVHPTLGPLMADDYFGKDGKIKTGSHAHHDQPMA